VLRITQLTAFQIHTSSSKYPPTYRILRREPVKSNPHLLNFNVKTILTALSLFFELSLPNHEKDRKDKEGSVCDPAIFRHLHVQNCKQSSSFQFINYGGAKQ
jgi:hypothetical protein